MTTITNRPNVQAKSPFGAGTGAPGTTKEVRRAAPSSSTTKPNRNKPKAKPKPKSVAAKTKDATEGVKDKGGSIGAKKKEKRTAAGGRKVMTQRDAFKEDGSTVASEYR